MKLVDTRKLSPDAQEAIRLRGIRLVLDGEQSRTAAAELLGVTRVSVSNWVSAYLKQGEGAILKKKRGRRSMDKRLLAPHQCATIVTRNVCAGGSLVSQGRRCSMTMSPVPGPVAANMVTSQWLPPAKPGWFCAAMVGALASPARAMNAGNCAGAH